jgi:hypothetical protein
MESVRLFGSAAKLDFAEKCREAGVYSATWLRWQLHHLSLRLPEFTVKLQEDRKIRRKMLREIDDRIRNVTGIVHLAAIWRSTWGY